MLFPRSLKRFLRGLTQRSSRRRAARFSLSQPEQLEVRQLLAAGVTATETIPWSRFDALNRNSWPAESLLTTLNGNLYAIDSNSGGLYRVNQSSGSATALGGRDWTGATSFAALGSFLYVIQNSTLHRVDPGDGGYVAISGADWEAQTSLAAVGDKLYAIQDGKFWSIDVSVATSSSSFTPFNSTHWYDKTFMATNGDTAWVVERGELYIVNPGGGYSQLGRSDSWISTQGMTYLDGRLYIVESNQLWNVDPSSGSYSRVGTSTWRGNIEMTALDGSLYIWEGTSSTLFRVNPSNGTYTGIGSSGVWQSVTALTNRDGYLYVIENSRLHQVDPSSGGYTVLGGANWNGDCEMAARGNDLYVTQNGYLHRVNPSDGSYTVISGRDWEGTQVLRATSSNGLLAIQNSRMWRINETVTIPGSSFSRVGSSTWTSGSNLITAYDGALYVAETGTGKLWRVSTAGNLTQMGTAEWSNVTSISAANGYLYAFDNGSIRRIDPTTNGSQRISDRDWVGGTAMTALDGELYAVQNGVLWHIDVTYDVPKGVAAADVSLDGSVLNIVGDDGDNRVTVSTNKSVVTVTIESTSTDSFTLVPIRVKKSFAAASVTAIRFRGFDGDDRFVNFTKIPGTEVRGGAGNDCLQGGGGSDSIDGESGNDTVFGMGGRDLLYGGNGNDKLMGGDDRDQLDGEDGTDSLWGDGAADILIAIDNATIDYLTGGSGRDTFWVDANRDHVSDVKSAHKDRLQAVSAYTNGADRTLNGDRINDPTLDDDAERYERFDGPLFAATGPSADDIDQRLLGDCYFLAGLAAIARDNPFAITQNIVDFGDGTFGVRFGDSFYRVDNDLPVDAAGTPSYAQLGQEDSMWVAVMEKAFAHHRTGANSYASIEGGSGTEANRLLGSTTIGTKAFSSFSNARNLAKELADHLKKAEATTVDIFDGDGSDELVTGHSYTVISVSSGFTKITLRNPWGRDGGDITDDNPDDGLVTVKASELFAFTGAINWGKIA